MAFSVKLSDETIDKAKIASKASSRSVGEQVEHWVKIGKIVEDNPDLTYEMIKGILIASEEARTGKLKPYL